MKVRKQLCTWKISQSNWFGAIGWETVAERLSSDKRWKRKYRFGGVLLIGARKGYLIDDAENSTLIKIIGGRISIISTEEEQNMLWKGETIGNGRQHKGNTIAQSAGGWTLLEPFGRWQLRKAEPRYSSSAESSSETSLSCRLTMEK